MIPVTTTVLNYCFVCNIGLYWLVFSRPHFSRPNGRAVVMVVVRLSDTNVGYWLNGAR